MSQVRIANKRVWIGEKPLSLLSGEVHYWRLSPYCWRDVLRRVRELGLDLVSTYVCWGYHEVAEGWLDFRGQAEPQRNLVGFLDLVAEEGFSLLIRPGPYIYSEWVNAGVPNRVARYHRLHPQFLKAAEAYMAAVVEAIKPYLATQDGPIVLLQADNEPDPWIDVYGVQLGLGREPSLLQGFLRERYGEVTALNEAWETQLEDFSQARAITQPVIRERGYLNRYLDFCRFRHWYASKIARWTVNKYRELGVDVPIYLNAYPSLEIQNWRELEQAGDLAGPDFYPANEFRRDPDEHQHFLHMARYTRTYSALPFIAEFEAGIWHGWHYRNGVLTANHYLLACLSALLAGVAGWNWYMLVNRDNWYMSPINEWGRTRPELADAFARLVGLFRELDPPALEKVTATGVVVDVLQQVSRLENHDTPVLDALYRADIDYECYDVDTGRIAKPLMFYAGGDWLNRAGQERLLDYVETGGHVVFFQDLPVQDDTLCPLNLLGLRQPESILGAARPQQLHLRLGEETVLVSSPSFFSYDAVPGEPILAELAAEADPTQEEFRLHASLPLGEQFIVGYRQARGKGTLTCLGVVPSSALLLAVHHWLGMPVYSHARSPHVNTALFRRGHAYYLIAVNNGEENRDVIVAVHPELFESGLHVVRDLVTGEERHVNLGQEGCLCLRLLRKSGTIAKIWRLAE